jgi:hypothetical protein
MSQGACSMLPLVEARRDGRLDDRERASIERHLTACAQCRGLDEDFARLADLARGPRASTPTLVHHRGRMRLLQAAALIESPSDRGTLSGISTQRTPGAAGFRVPLAAAAAAAVTLIVVSGVHSRLATRDAARNAARPAPIEALPSAAPIAPLPSSAAPIVPVAPIAPVAETAPPPPPPVKRAVAAPRPAPSAPPSSEAASPQGDLAGGVGSLAQGNYGEAVERLRTFEQTHPGDARAEDAAFLAVVALERAGKHEAAVVAARAYLARYPQGYRREEAAAVAARK